MLHFEGTKMVFRLWLFTGLVALMGCVSCAPKQTPVESETGTVTVDAQISKGTRFNLYYNDLWAELQRQPVVAGQRTKYLFKVPSKLTSLRLDPSEAADAEATIYSVIISLPGGPPRALRLSDLPKFLMYHCAVALQDGNAVVHASGPDMYFMSTVAPGMYPAVSN